MARPRIIEKDALSMQLKKAEYLISHADINETEKVYNLYNYKGKKLNTIFFRKVKKVGQGGQGIVYQIEIEGKTNGHYVDKMARFEGKSSLLAAHQKINEAYNEFIMGKNLRHPHIIEYKHFVHRYDAIKNRYESHTILEMLDGKDMAEYIRAHPTSFERGIDVI